MTKKATWEDIKKYADAICNVRACGIDLVWAKRAWQILEDTPLCDYSSSQEFNVIVIRLFCISEIIHIYNYFMIDESYEPYEAYSKWVDELGLQKIKLIMLAGQLYYEDSYVEEYGEISEVINHLMNMHYDMVIKWLVKGFGGRDSMVDSLENPSGVGSESFSYEEAVSMGMKPGKVYVSNEALRLHQWKESGFTRDYA